MTIKELSEEIGVSKTAIRDKMSEEFRNQYVDKMPNGQLRISKQGCEIMRDYFRKAVEDRESKKAEPQRNEDNTTVLIEMLRHELNEKNKQIESLQNALIQEQQLNAVSVQRLLMLEEESAKKKRKHRWKKRSKDNSED